MSHSELLRLSVAQNMLVFIFFPQQIQTCFYPPHSGSIPRGSLCPWIPHEWFHQTPVKRFRQENTAEVELEKRNPIVSNAPSR